EKTVLEETNSESEDDFEVKYKVPVEDKNGDDRLVKAVQNASNPLASQHPFDLPLFMRVLDIDSLNQQKFSEYAYT
ncbi:hypothetical protein PIB30_081873, partial [Stylosanthes scabra]|nr:hypothetical protein [Stylosanthes scabra]